MGQSLQWLLMQCFAQVPTCRCCCCMVQALESNLAEACDLGRDTLAAGIITITCSLPGGGDVGDLWAAMELAGMADKHLAAIAGEKWFGMVAGDSVVRQVDLACTYCRHACTFYKVPPLYHIYNWPFGLGYLSRAAAGWGGTGGRLK